MTTHNLCAVALGTDPKHTVMINGHSINSQDFLARKRMNNLLSTELGLLCSVSGLTQIEALELTCQVVVKRLLARTPSEDLRTFLGTIYSDYYEYRGKYPHVQLGRCEIDRSYPVGMTMLATPEQMIVMNILGKILQDDDDVASFYLLLEETVIAYLMLTLKRDFQELSTLFGIPKEEVRKDNIVQFGTPSVDNTYDPFAQ